MSRNSGSLERLQTPSAQARRTLALILLASMLLSVLMMTRDHNWGDDFAAYLMQAQSIFRGDMQAYVANNTFTMEESSHVFGPITEPWGYPLMLSPVYALLGLRVQALKLVAVACYAALLGIFFFFLRTRLSERESLLLTAVLAFNVGMLGGTDEILADIPFALWSTLSLWLITMPTSRSEPGGNLKHAALVGVAMFAAAFTRIAGFLIFVPAVAAQISYLRGRFPQGVRLWNKIRPAAVTFAVFGTLYGLQMMIFPSVGHVAPFGTITWRSIWENLIGYFWAPAYFLRNIVFGAQALHVVLLPFFAISVARRRKRDLPLHLYILATLAILIVRQGFAEPRYLFPLWPLFLLFTYDGMKLAANRLGGAWKSRGLALLWNGMLVFAVISVAACLQVSWLNLRARRYDYRESRGAFHPTTNLMFEFVREKTAPDSVIIFFKPRAMRLRTGRDSFFTTQCEDLPKGDYVAIEKSMGGYDQILPQEVRRCNPSVVLTPAYEKDQFVVYQVGSAQ